MKLIIDIDDNKYNRLMNMPMVSSVNEAVIKAVKNGIPLEDVKAEIAEQICLTDNQYTKETKYTIEHLKLLEILDNIRTAESERMNEVDKC